MASADMGVDYSTAACTTERSSAESLSWLGWLLAWLAVMRHSNKITAAIFKPFVRRLEFSIFTSIPMPKLYHVSCNSVKKIDAGFLSETTSIKMHTEKH
jgi:hypothetical protein